MASLHQFILSESVSLDRDTNRISYFHIVEQVNASEFPTALMQCVATATWSSETGDHERDFQMVLRVTPPGSEPQEFPLNFRFEEGKVRHRLIYRLSPIPLPAAGELRFAAILNGEVHRELVLPVLAVQVPVNVGPAANPA